MVFSLSVLPQELREPTRLVLTELGHETGETGIRLIAEQGSVLCLRREQNGVVITYARRCEWFRGLTFLRAADCPEQKPLFGNLCYMADCSRNAVYNMDCAKKMIRVLALMGYDSFMLYTEDTYEIPGEPYFGHLRGRFTQAELRELDGYAAQFGIEMIPCIQTLAHLDSPLRWSYYKPVLDCDNILMADEEKTYELIDRMLASMAECFTTRRINIGMDEAHTLGLGRHLKRFGFEDRRQIMLRHVSRVVELCRKHGFRPMMWSDMFFRLVYGSYYSDGGAMDERFLHEVPADMTLIFWDYYSTEPEKFRERLRCHHQFDNPIVFAGGAWKWSGYAPHNRFSFRATGMMLDELRKDPVSMVIATGWGDNGADASQFSVLPSLSQYAETQYGCENALESRFFACFGRTRSDFLLLDLPDLPPALPEDATVMNPSKYLLFNDPMQGLFDWHTTPEYALHYRESAKKLLAAEDGPYGYLFRTAGRLSMLLASKATLGMRLHTAYCAGDRRALADLRDEITDDTLPSLKKFYAAFREQWEKENRPFGFEVQDQRLGGLRQRLETAADELTRYLSGELAELPELAAERLPYTKLPDDAGESRALRFNTWRYTVSAGTI